MRRLRVVLLAAGLGAGLVIGLGTGAHAAPDAARGEQLYARCAACHALAADRVGPRHCGLIGRVAGSVPGFDYSPAMRRSGLRWTEAELDRFLAAPLKRVPGSTMTYDGVDSPTDRADLIAYLRQTDKSAACSKAAGKAR